MSFSCSRPFSLTINDADMPLDDAVYDSGRNLIYGVRGPFVYTIDPTTGAKIIREVFNPYSACGLSQIDYDSTNDLLIAITWNDEQYVLDAITGALCDKYFFYLDPINLHAVATTRFDLALVTTRNQYAKKAYGPHRIICDGGFGYGTGWLVNATATRPAPYKFLITPVGTAGKGGLVEFGGYADCARDKTGGRDYLWVTFQASNALYSYNCAAYAMTLDATTVDHTKMFYAVAVDATTGNVYVTDVLRYVYKFDGTGALISTIDTGRPLFNGLRIQFNPNDGKLYAAGAADNTIAIIDPTSADSVSMKSGFDFPIDLVFTPTKSFAVQQGAVGLKEIV